MLSYNDLLLIANEMRRVFKCDDMRIDYVLDRHDMFGAKFDAVSGAFVVNSNQKVSELIRSLCLCVWRHYRSSYHFRHHELVSKDVVVPMARYFVQNASQSLVQKLQSAMR